MILLDILNHPASVLDWVNTGGIIGLLLFIIVGGAKKWWVWGWQYKSLEESNARWMDLALRSTNLAESLDNYRKQQPIR